MASAATTKQTKQLDRSVSRIYRVAAKIGDDYYTIEESVVLPIGATDAEIIEAISLGTRIYQAQQEAAAAQLAQLRAAVPPAPPRRPTEKQLNAVGALQAKVSISTIAAVYKELEIVGTQPQTFDQASALIDRLKAIINGIAPDPAADRSAAQDTDAAPSAPDNGKDLPF